MWCRMAVEAITVDKRERTIAGRKQRVLVVRNNGSICESCCNLRNKSWLIYGFGYVYDVVGWMPIPSFDEILEANRDVLERIKEKGD